VGVVIGWVVGFLAVRFVLLAGGDMLRSPALARLNYRGAVLATAGGLFVVMAVLLVEAGRAGLGSVGVGEAPGVNTVRPLVLFAAFGFGLLGFMDDVLGSEDRGFKGHLRALSQGRLTSGMLKLVGGAGVALVLASAPGFVTGQRLVADALLIALAANLGNLLDRAPGRTIKWSLVAYVPIAIVAGTDMVGIALAPFIGATLGLLPDDLHERLMLGDAGANVLGGVLGLAVVLECSRTTRNIVLVVLIALNLASEVVSFSRMIERVPPLRWFDRLGRRPASIDPPTDPPSDPSDRTAP
jgi:UDP-N-acetylmuramyl pentapeptide phosphotransferase/UDP-N-acetylglucosamine-1-phosphate transferase